MNGFIASLISAILSGCAVFYFTHKQPAEPSKVKELTVTNDSIRAINKSITEALEKTTAEYHQTDSTLKATLNKLNHTAYVHHQTNLAHAALPVDSAVGLFLDRFNGGSNP